MKGPRFVALLGPHAATRAKASAVTSRRRAAGAGGDTGVPPASQPKAGFGQQLGSLETEPLMAVGLEAHTGWGSRRPWAPAYSLLKPDAGGRARRDRPGSSSLTPLPPDPPLQQPVIGASWGGSIQGAPRGSQCSQPPALLPVWAWAAPLAGQPPLFSTGASPAGPPPRRSAAPPPPSSRIRVPGWGHCEKV